MSELRNNKITDVEIIMRRRGLENSRISFDTKIFVPSTPAAAHATLHIKAFSVEDYQLMNNTMDTLVSVGDLSLILRVYNVYDLPLVVLSPEVLVRRLRQHPTARLRRRYLRVEEKQKAQREAIKYVYKDHDKGQKP
ncbi:hypothetical protein J6590_001010 [Homalodisca vitripennis]|nr:hypothetical protein J6590_001010 [Homalodisca vitripennis]